MNYVKAHVRLEGSVNQFWDMTREDGTVDEFYAIEGSPRYSLTNGVVHPHCDDFVHNFDPKLSDQLFDLSCLEECDEDQCIEFDVELNDLGAVTITHDERF